MNWPDDFVNKVIHGDCLDVMREMPDKAVNCCVTSPPYWGLRDYGVDGQLGLEKTPEEYTEKMVVIFRELKRILREDGTLWLNLGDSYNSGSGGYSDKYNGSFVGREDIKAKVLSSRAFIDKRLKPKDLVGIPWRVAFALQADGWYLRSDIIWSKPNPMPESVTDRPTKSHEYIFLLSKSRKYYYDAEAIREPCIYPGDDRKGRAKGDHKQNSQVDGKVNRIQPRKEYCIPSGRDIKKGDHSTIHQQGSLPKKDKQRGHGRRYAGFNDRWYSMTKEEQGLNGRNKRSVWTIATHPYPEAHFATFPEKLIEPCILAGCPEGGIVIDPFIGSGTTAKVAQEMKRNFIGIELNQEYIPLIEKRTAQGVL